MGISSVIFGCKGRSLTNDERQLYRKMQPWGFILFARNIDTPEQVSELVRELKSCVDHDDVPILIDQEGGRVQRMCPPHWPVYHCGQFLGGHYKSDNRRGLRLAWLQSRLMACDLVKAGINVDCLPVLDVPVPGSDDVIGDRAYANDAETVAKMGMAASQGLLDGGILPVIKHIPGHGRAGVDSHKDLPVVDTPLEELVTIDFEPFKHLSAMPLAMTAHVVYTAIDSESPATTSRSVIDGIIRGHIGFEGVLMSDDLSMHALSGDFSERTHSAFAAGCDVVLHCNGEMEEMETVAAVLPELSGKPLERARRAVAMFHSENPCNETELRKEFEALGKLKC